MTRIVQSEFMRAAFLAGLLDGRSAASRAGATVLYLNADCGLDSTAGSGASAPRPIHGASTRPQVRSCCNRGLLR